MYTCKYIHIYIHEHTYPPENKIDIGVSTLQNTATFCITLQHTATQTAHQHSKSALLQKHSQHHTATHCNTLQHTATHCATLQHTATHTMSPPAFEIGIFADQHARLI